MAKFTMTEQQVAQRFGCTIEQVRAGHASNARALRGMLFKARTAGKKVNGYTAEQLQAHVDRTEKLASGLPA